LRKFTYFCSVFKSRQSDVQKSEESVRLAREGRKVGARTNTDLLDAEADLYRSQAGAVTAQLGAIEALINLELSTGQALYHFQ
jgi:outer membrane protein TolC